MELKEAFKIALQSLWANKLRSVLTLLGVVIGVSSVIAVITLTNGVNKYVATKVYGYGADVFTLSKQSPVIFSYEQWQKFQKRKNIKIEDYYAIQQDCKSCANRRRSAQYQRQGRPPPTTPATTPTFAAGAEHARYLQPQHRATAAALFPATISTPPRGHHRV